MGLEQRSKFAYYCKTVIESKYKMELRILKIIYLAQFLYSKKNYYYISDSFIEYQSYFLKNLKEFFVTPSIINIFKNTILRLVQL